MNKQFQQRKRNRLANYDYSSEGIYFITICAFENRYLFRYISDGEMVPSRLGSLVKEWWGKIPGQYPEVRLEDFVVMPNHFHGIIVIEEREASEGRERKASEA
jgi:REP element-mobilizing transposase RayT